MKYKSQHICFLCRVTYFYSFDTYILKIRREICKLQAVEVHMHNRHATTKEFFPQNYDVISADYDVSPSCRFSHATAHVSAN